MSARTKAWYSIERMDGPNKWTVLDSCHGRAEADRLLKEMRLHGIVSRGQWVRIERIDPRSAACATDEPEASR